MINGINNKWKHNVDYLLKIIFKVITIKINSYAINVCIIVMKSNLIFLLSLITILFNCKYKKRHSYY